MERWSVDSHPENGAMRWSVCDDNGLLVARGITSAEDAELIARAPAMAQLLIDFEKVASLDPETWAKHFGARDILHETRLLLSECDLLMRRPAELEQERERRSFVRMARAAGHEDPAHAWHPDIDDDGRAVGQCPKCGAEARCEGLATHHWRWSCTSCSHTEQAAS